MSAVRDAASPSSRLYARFTLSQRLQHLVLVVSFTTLAVTGLPQRYALHAWGEATISLLGGIEALRVTHRWAAVVLLLAGIWHLFDVGYHLVVARVRLTLLPRYHDLLHLWQALRYNLGLAPERPRQGRYTFEEKVEYWALVWGTVIMAITGFMLWNPIATARFLPGQFIPAAQVAHSAEALLAVLAVIIWHGYGVHLRHFNRSMFTGTMTAEEMREEHPLELEEIESDRTPPEPAPDVLRRRRRVFVPAAALLCLGLVAGLWWFLTFEQTAITTVPPRARPELAAPAQAVP